jgi:hypothetical protein
MQRYRRRCLDEEGLDPFIVGDIVTVAVVSGGSGLMSELWPAG